MCRQEFADGQVRNAQQMAEVAEAPCRCKRPHFVAITKADEVQAQRRAWRELVVYMPALLVAYDDDRHFDRHNPPFAIIQNDFGAHVLSRYELTHKAIILDPNILNNSVNLVAWPEWRPDEGTERGHVQLVDAAADYKS
jgi:hypothetical protein